jgi:tripartite-type tricarboxylate transporter receptor subunit TctC
MNRRPLLALAALSALLLALSAAAQSPWPSKPVRVVVPAPAGSSLDLIVRSMSEKLAARWGQPVVVENKPGAGGMLGMDVAAKASDGHTLAIGFNGPVAFAPFLYRKMPYDPAKDLLPVVMTTSQANVLAVSVDKVPAKTVAEFVAWAKAQGGKMNYSSLGNGSSAHLTMELFLSEAGITATHIPFNGSPPAASR